MSKHKRIFHLFGDGISFFIGLICAIYGMIAASVYQTRFIRFHKIPFKGHWHERLGKKKAYSYKRWPHLFSGKNKKQYMGVA